MLPNSSRIYFTRQTFFFFFFFRYYYYTTTTTIAAATTMRKLKTIVKQTPYTAWIQQICHDTGVTAREALELAEVRRS